MSNKEGTIYVASKTKHADKWKALRAEGVPIVSTWIDEAGQGESIDMKELSLRCIKEAQQADVTLVYYEEGEYLKGAFIEMGVALAAGKYVFLYGTSLKEASVFTQHPYVPCYGPSCSFDTVVRDAVMTARRMRKLASSPSQEEKPSPVEPVGVWKNARTDPPQINGHYFVKAGRSKDRYCWPRKQLLEVVEAKPDTLFTWLDESAHAEPVSESAAVKAILDRIAERRVEVVENYERVGDHGKQILKAEHSAYLAALNFIVEYITDELLASQESQPPAPVQPVKSHEETAEELWQSLSQTLEDRPSDFDQYAGREMMTQDDFYKALEEYRNQPTQQTESDAVAFAEWTHKEGWVYDQNTDLWHQYIGDGQTEEKDSAELYHEWKSQKEKEAQQ